MDGIVQSRVHAAVIRMYGARYALESMMRLIEIELYISRSPGELRKDFQFSLNFFLSASFISFSLKNKLLSVLLSWIGERSVILF